MALEHVLAASENPAADAAIVGRLFASEPNTTGDGAYAVDTGNSTIRFETASGLAARYAGADLGGLNASGLVGLVLRTRSIAGAEAALARGGAAHARTKAGLAVAPRDACGVLLVFSEA